MKLSQLQHTEADDNMLDRTSPPLRLTAGKKEIKDFPKLPSTTSFICKPLGETASMTGSDIEVI